MSDGASGRGPVVNVDDVELSTQSNGDDFEARVGAVAPLVGARGLGCRVCEVAPGKRAWPFHNHHRNEELFVILEGEGTYRFGDERFAVRTGDVLGAPAGGPETAHQIVNTSGEMLRYLAISTMEQPEVAEYPDSGKVGVIAGSAPGAAAGRRVLSFFHAGDAVDYWEGE